MIDTSSYELNTKCCMKKSLKIHVVRSLGFDDLEMCHPRILDTSFVARQNLDTGSSPNILESVMHRKTGFTTVRGHV